MNKHLFLTGPINIGKSTIIKQVLKKFALIPGGFRTYGGLSPQWASDIFLAAANASGFPCTMANRVAHRLSKGKYQAFPKVFDTLGVSILTKATAYPLIVMDELGFMEGEAYNFQRAVLQTISGQVPILGVIKPDSTPFLDLVRSCPELEIIEVSETNRDNLPQKIVELLKCLL